MKHQKYKDLLELNVLGELTKEEEIELENHLFECEECAEEYSQIKSLYKIVLQEKPEKITDKDLIASRTRLFNTILAQKKELTLTEKISEFISSLLSNKFAFAFSSVILVFVGIYVGYLIFNNTSISNDLFKENVIDLDRINKGEIEISKVKLPDMFLDDYQFEFQLGSSKTDSYRGDLNDIGVQKLLAAALERTDNPGFKIKTANIIAELTEDNFAPDEKIKNALIYTLKNDDNPGVRKGALGALINFPYDNDIRDAFIYALKNDENTSNRIDAINALLSMNLSVQLLNDTLKAQLANKLKIENNSVVKNKTLKLLIGGNANGTKNK